VDTKDLYLVSIDNALSSLYQIETPVFVQATLQNRSEYNNFEDVNITVRVTNSIGEETAKFTETIAVIEILSTVNYTFAHSYTVPKDTVYYLNVYIDPSENYPHNDTIVIKCTTYQDNINVTGKDGFVLGQNIPNPANARTRIDYSVPEAGEVVFHVHSISGQLLYSKTIETERGIQSIELNTSTFSAGVYFYSIEYKGQKLVKRMSVK
jgi:hypothetical protein